MAMTRSRRLLTAALLLATLLLPPLAAAATELSTTGSGSGGTRSAATTTDVLPDNVLRYLALRGKTDDDVRACAPLVKPGMIAANARGKVALDEDLGNVFLLGLPAPRLTRLVQQADPTAAFDRCVDAREKLDDIQDEVENHQDNGRDLRNGFGKRDD